jgi:hypothetical protein
MVGINMKPVIVITTVVGTITTMVGINMKTVVASQP